jgi:hypothetical protein
MLPIIGSLPAFGAVADDGLTSGYATIRGYTTYKNATLSTAHTVSISPAQTGDLVLVWMLNSGSGPSFPPTALTPLGWTHLLQHSFSGSEVNVFWAIASSSFSADTFSFTNAASVYANSMTFSAHSGLLFAPAVSTVEQAVSATHNPPSPSAQPAWGSPVHFHTLSCVAKVGANTTTSNGGYVGLMNTGDSATRMMTAYALYPPHFDPPAWTTSAATLGMAFTIWVRGVD